MRAAMALASQALNRRGGGKIAIFDRGPPPAGGGKITLFSNSSTKFGRKHDLGPIGSARRAGKIDRMAANRPFQAGVGAMVALALLLAGDLGGRAESAAPESAGAKTKEKVPEKVPEKAAGKVAEQTGASAVPA